MVRVMSAVLALFAFGVLPATAADPTLYRDPDGRFTVSVPTGWTAAYPKGSEIALMMTSSVADDNKGGACYVAVRDMPQTRDTPQKDLDEAFGQVLTTDFWKNLFETSGIKDAKIESIGDRTQKGRKVYHVIATVAAADKDGTVVQATGRQEVHPVPGSLQFIQCVAAKNIYAQVEPTFTAIFASFDPKSNQLLVRATPQGTPSVVTLYAGQRADGAAVKVIAQNTANVPALSGSGVTTGIAIAGAGRWEICEGVNYSGNCSIVGGATTGEPGQAMRIGSVRRYLGGHDMKDAAAIIAATTIAAFKAGPENIVQAKR